MTAVQDHPTTAATSDPVAEQIAALVGPMFRGHLPIRIKAWDGSEAGPADAPTLVVRSPQALTRVLYRPGELGIAQAYVTGEIDVEGDLLDGFRRLWAAVREHGAARRLTPATIAPTSPATPSRTRSATSSSWFVASSASARATGTSTSAAAGDRWPCTSPRRTAHRSSG